MSSTAESVKHYPVHMAVKPQVEPFFEPATNTISYVVKDPASDACALIAPSSLNLMDWARAFSSDK